MTTVTVNAKKNEVSSFTIIALGYRAEEPNMPVHRPLDEIVKFY